MSVEHQIEELNCLLRDAAAMGETGWSQCWGLVHALLQPVHPYSLGACMSLGYVRDDIFTEFFGQKFFLRATVVPPLRIESQRALAGWWSHFCTDVLRHHARFANTTSLEDCEEMPAVCQHDEATISIDQRQKWGQEARRFLEGLEDGLRAMVREHLCMEDSHQTPLQAVARRWRVRSYHYRARQLGLTGTKQAFNADFRKSAIGCWMRSLGCDPHPDNRDQMRIALEVLCIEATSRPERPPEARA